MANKKSSFKKDNWGEEGSQPVEAPKVVHPIEEHKPKPVVQDMTVKPSGQSVTIINKHPIDGKFVVRRGSGEFFLVPTDVMDVSYAPQNVDAKHLTERPYGWTSELKELGMPLLEGQKALYQSGFVAEGVDIARILQELRNRGVKPIAKDV